MGRKDLGTGILLNRTDGGEGTNGRISPPCSDSTKKKLSDSKLGEKNHNYKKLTESMKKNLKPFKSGKDNINFGKVYTEIEKQNLSEKLSGRVGNPRTIEHTEKLVEIFSKTYIVTSPFDESFVVKNLSKFCREEGLSQGLMSAVANKKRTHHKKWKCEHYKGN